jgi:hypothetical protein
MHAFDLAEMHPDAILLERVLHYFSMHEVGFGELADSQSNRSIALPKTTETPTRGRHDPNVHHTSIFVQATIFA